MKNFFNFCIGLSLVLAMNSVVKAQENPFSSSECWIRQLENIDLEKLRASTCAVLVLHYSRDGAGIEPFSRDEIRALQDTGKTVLGYLPLAEAEIFEDYWNPAWETIEKSAPCFETYFRQSNNRFESRRCEQVVKPQWLGPQNPQNLKYIVRYWSSAWWKLALEPYLQRIAAAGFDGVYVDTANAALFWNRLDPRKYPRASLYHSLLQLLTKIKSRGSSLSTPEHFWVVLGDSVEIISAITDPQRTQLLRNIDAVGISDFFYNSWKQWSIFRLNVLKRFVQFNDIVFLSIEWIDAQTYPEYLEKVETLQNMNFQQPQLTQLKGDPIRLLRIRKRFQQRIHEQIKSLRIIPFQDEQ